MTSPPRPAVFAALIAAGWKDDTASLVAYRHPSGAALVAGLADNCSLYCPLPDAERAHVGFASDVPDAVVIAACLAASGQLDPVQDMERSDWLGWLEAAGIDNWEGEGVAIDLRDEHEREQQNP